MSGISYDLSKIKAFVFDVDGVLSPSTIPLSEDGTPVRMANIKDGYALQLAVKAGYKIAIITGGDTENIRKRYEVLGITDIYLKASHKLEILKDWMQKNNLLPEAVIYMGDDIPDLKCMRHVGLPCCPYDAASEVRQTASYISPVPGGYGCARDVIQQVMAAAGEWLKDDKAFGW